MSTTNLSAPLNAPQPIPMDAITYEPNDIFECGGFSDIYHGFLEQDRDDGDGKETIEVAVKVFRRKGDPRERLKKHLQREVKVWKDLNHSNVAKFIGITTKKVNRVAVVMPWYPEGTVHTYLRKHPNASRLELVRGVAAGLKYLHGKSIVHGDVKPSNTLVSDDGRALLSDFGVAKDIDAIGPSGLTTTGGHYTLLYCSPERLQAGRPGPGRLVTPIREWDVWAFGCTAYEILAGKAPHADVTLIYGDIDIWQAIMAGRPPFSRDSTDPREQWLMESPAIYKALEDCWSQDKGARPTMETTHQELMNAELATEYPEDIA